MGKAKRPAKSAIQKKRNPTLPVARWTEVGTLTFEGPRFDDHGLDLDVCIELARYHQLVVDTAKALWRSTNPGKKLPMKFEQGIRLRIDTLGRGSTRVPIQAMLESPEGKLWDDMGSTVEQAIDTSWQLVSAVEHDETLPEVVPRDLLSDYARWGESLHEGESLALETPSRRPVRVSADTRARLAQYRETPYEDLIEISGTVEEANVRRFSFQVWRDDQVMVTVKFDESREAQVTTALKEHRVRKVIVRGQGKRKTDGTPEVIERIDSLEFVALEGPRYDDRVPPIEETLARIWADVPPEEWAKLPRDGSKNLDHYIYGTPKE